MKRQLVSAMIISAAVTVGVCWASSVRADATQRLQSAAEVLKQIASLPDKGIPDEVVKNAKCVAVIPNLVKAGLIVGGKYGRGVAVCRRAKKQSGGWSAPAFITIGGGTFGPQIGAEGVDLVMVVMNDKGLEALTSNKIRMSLEGSAAAGPVGRHATVGSDWKGDTEILTYARSKGAFAGQTLEGAVIEQDDDSTKAIYGSDVPSSKLLSGAVTAPSAATSFRRALSEISRAAAEKQTARR